MGSIDKFGRRKVASCISSRGPQGVGFKLTNEKQYDIQGKQLKNIGEPTNENDGTSMQYVNKIINACKKDTLKALQQSANLISDNFVAFVKRERAEIVLEVVKLFKISQNKMEEEIRDIKVKLDELKSDLEKKLETQNNLVKDVEKFEEIPVRHHASV